MTSYDSGHNEYLDQTIGLPEDPVGASIGVSSVGQQLMGAGGSQQLQATAIGGTPNEAGKVPLLNAAGVFDASLLDYNFQGTAGGAITAGMTVTINTSNLIVKTPSTGNSRHIGIAANTVAAGGVVYVKTGPVIGDLSGLLPGYVYYATSGGLIATGTSTTRGGYGGTYYAPLGVAISTTELLLFYGGSAGFTAGEATLAIPAIGTSADTTIQTALMGAGPAYGWGVLYLQASDAASGNTTKRIYDWTWGGTVSFYHEINGAGAASLGIIDGSSNMTVVPNAGTNRSTITVKVNQGAVQQPNYGGVIVRVTNAIAAGTGSTVGSIRLIYNFIS